MVVVVDGVVVVSVVVVVMCVCLVMVVVVVPLEVTKARQWYDKVTVSEALVCIPSFD